MKLLLDSVAIVLALWCEASFAQDVSKISPKNGPYEDIPLLGMGTWNLARNTSEAVAAAIEAGYRHFDCATAYSNQKDVGAGFKEGLRRTGLKREDLWITSKIWTNRHSAQVKVGIENNLKELGLDYIDLTLMHFPIGNTNGKAEYDFIPTWKEMEKYAGTGSGKLTRFIGISNFNKSMIDDLYAAATIKPKVHQYERHPYLQDNSFVEFHKQKNLQTTSYAPLGNTNPSYSMRARKAGAPPPLLDNPVIKSIAAARGCTPAQVALKWQMDQGIVVHPKTQRPSRMKENFEAYTKCSLQAEDHQKIKDMEKTWSGRFWDICQTMMGLPCYTGLQKND